MKTNLPLPPHCTFEEKDWQLLATYWHAVALSTDVTEQPLKAKLMDEELVLYRFKGNLVVARDVCPHRGVPLSLGKNDDGEGVVCPYHGLRFGDKGHCNRVPSSPCAPIASKLNLITYRAEERYGLIWVCLAAEEGDEPNIPNMPYWDHPDFQQINCPAFEVNGFAGRQVEGFIDVAHFAWIHTATFADPNNQVVPDYTTTETEWGFIADYYSDVGNYPMGKDGDPVYDFKWLRHFEVHAPFTATLTIDFPEDTKQVIMNTASPVSARVTRMFAPICRSFDKHLPIQEALDFNLRVFEEDRMMVETQRPKNYHWI